MSRRRKAAKRAHLPDARYGSPLISQLINVVMKSGKKSIAQGIVYGAIEKVSEKLMKGNPVELMLGALENCRPKLEVKSRRRTRRRLQQHRQRGEEARRDAQDGPGQPCLRPPQVVIRR
jgi:ribosomal protein S7